MNRLPSKMPMTRPAIMYAQGMAITSSIELSSCGYVLHLSYRKHYGYCMGYGFVRQYNSSRGVCKGRVIFRLPGLCTVYWTVSTTFLQFHPDNGRVSDNACGGAHGKDGRSDRPESRGTRP